MKESFLGKLGRYTFIDTGDGSFTLHSEAFDENCHSTDGAWEETLFNYVDSCKVASRYETSLKPFTIFEVGLGLGLGYLATVVKLKSIQSKAALTFISCEIDPTLIEFVKGSSKKHHHPKFPEFCDLVKTRDGIWQAQKTNNTLIIIEGDIRIEAPKYFDTHKDLLLQSVYQDAFSPRKNPSLWTWQWFELLRKYSAQDCILSTYSSSASVRKSMHKAGWKVHNQKGFGRKKSKTLCLNTGEDDPSLIHVLNHGKALPLADETIIS
ncbi:MnmC family methyltransferase [Bacteriovoracaceae bacterium]|nr:MnmC family methyltransferase [Bacteriovoracaceae bacterium]